jgi:hypothetical protein
MRSAVALLTVIITGPAWCQSAPSPMLRSWPISGDWYVALVRARSLAGQPACLMMTGYTSQNKPDYRIWGVRVGGNELMLNINSKRLVDVSGPEMEVSVDNYIVGRFPVTDRPPGHNDVTTAVASVMDASAQTRLLGLIHAGSVIRITNGQAVFEASLDQTAAANFEKCRQEAELLSR